MLRFRLCDDLSGLLDRSAPGQPAMAPNSSTSCFVILFPVISCSWIYSNLWPVQCPPAVCQSPRHSNHVLDGLVVPSSLQFQSSDFRSSEGPFCNSNETFCAVVSRFNPHSELVSGIIFMDSVEMCHTYTFPAHGSNSCDGFLPCTLLEWRPFWHLDRMLPAWPSKHGRAGEPSLSSSCVMLI